MINTAASFSLGHNCLLVCGPPWQRVTWLKDSFFIYEKNKIGGLKQKLSDGLLAGPKGLRMCSQVTTSIGSEAESPEGLPKL